MGKEFRGDFSRSGRIHFLSALRGSLLLVVAVSSFSIFRMWNRSISGGMGGNTFGDGRLPLSGTDNNTGEVGWTRWDAHLPFRPTVDDVCGGCRLAETRDGKTCGQLILDRVLERNTSVRAAANFVALNQSRYCKQCHISHPSCNSTVYNQYWRFDHVRPRSIRPNDGLAARTHYFESLPSEFRLPDLNSTNFALFFRNSSNWLSNRTFYFEFNPTIIPLPWKQTPPDLLSPLMQKDRAHYYLAAYRISDLQDCFTPEQVRVGHFRNEKGIHEPATELLGLAILDAGLSMVRETIVKAHHKDVRLFLLNTQIYIGIYHVIRPIWIHPGAVPQNIPPESLQHREKLFPDSQLRSFPVIEQKHYACCTSPTCNGKNFNYFSLPTGEIFVETNPVNPHVVELMNMTQRCQKRNYGTMKIDVALAEEYDKARVHVWPTKATPSESFFTTDEIYFPRKGVYRLPYTRDRGTACCVTIQDVRLGQNSLGASLMVGVSHTKIPMFGNWYETFRASHNLSFAARQYSSRLYAFEPKPPFRIVARSGSFCMGFPESSEETNENPYIKYVRSKPMIVGEELECPSITFVSGICEAIDDPSVAPISYGMNDCAPRIVKVPKSELIRLLFPSL
jgi:hypothetical protein